MDCKEMGYKEYLEYRWHATRIMESLISGGYLTHLRCESDQSEDIDRLIRLASTIASRMIQEFDLSREESSP